MKKLILIAAILSSVLTAEAFAQKTKLASGKNVSIRILNDISSKTNKQTQQEAVAIVERDVMDASGEYVLISRGTPVQLSTTVVKAKGVGKPGAIKINCLSTTAVDGQHIALLGGLSIQGNDKQGLALGLGLGLGLTILFPVGFACLAIPGENVEIPSNTIIQNVIVNDTYQIATE